MLNLVVHIVTTGPSRVKEEYPVECHVCFHNMVNIRSDVASVCHGLLEAALQHFVLKWDRGPLNTESDQLVFKIKVYCHYDECLLKDGTTVEACIQILKSIRSYNDFIGPVILQRQRN